MRIHISAECATVLFIVAVLDFARTVANGSYTLSLLYALLSMPIRYVLCIVHIQLSHGAT